MTGSLSAEPAMIRIGRAEIGGRATNLIAIDGRIMRLAEAAPWAPGAASGSLDGMFDDWDAVAARLIRDVAADGAAVDAGDITRYLAPFEKPPHLICIGANYHDHIAEMKAKVPVYPYGFLKPRTTIAPPAGPVVLPAMSRMVDWEAELGVVIGRRVRNVRAEDALDCVAGYLPLNDVSARDWIEERPTLGIDWVMQKGHDGFTPLAPWMTLASSVPDPQALPIRCLLNGEVMQDGSTADMVFGIGAVIAHLSAIMTLSPGDIIATGTPAGVGFGRSPRRFIADGDVVGIAMGPLGSFETRFVAADG